MAEDLRNEGRKEAYKLAYLHLQAQMELLKSGMPAEAILHGFSSTMKAFAETGAPHLDYDHLEE